MLGHVDRQLALSGMLLHKMSVKLTCGTDQDSSRCAAAYEAEAPDCPTTVYRW